MEQAGSHHLDYLKGGSSKLISVIANSSDASRILSIFTCRFGGLVGHFLHSTLVTGWVPTLVRAGRGMMLFQRARLQPPEKLLELYSYENNQVCSLHEIIVSFIFRTCS